MHAIFWLADWISQSWLIQSANQEQRASKACRATQHKNGLNSMCMRVCVQLCVCVHVCIKWVVHASLNTLAYCSLANCFLDCRQPPAAMYSKGTTCWLSSWNRFVASSFTLFPSFLQLPSCSFVFLLTLFPSCCFALSLALHSVVAPTATLFVVFFGQVSVCRSFVLFPSSLRVPSHTLHFLVMQLRQPRYKSEHLDRCHPGEVVFCVGYNCATDLSATAARGTLKEVLLRFGGRGRKETKKETKARLATVGGAWLRGVQAYTGDAHLARACTNIPCMHI